MAGHAVPAAAEPGRTAAASSTTHPPPDPTHPEATRCEPARVLRPGERLGRFEITRELGRGGFAVVYEARDTVLWRTVALKLVRTEGTPADELVHEAEALAALQHPCIVTLHELGITPGGYYLVFERLEGETLAERLRRGPLKPREALALAVDVARALDHAHARGVVHRDLKPGNVFLCSDGAVKVLDFGLAALFGLPAPLGATPGFSAPEQLQGLAGDERSDVYAAAATLGATLGEGAPGDAGARPSLRGQPRTLSRLLEEALAAEPERRPADGRAWLSRLLAAQAQLAAARTRVSLLIAAAVGVLLGAASLIAAANRPGSDSHQARDLLVGAEAACDADKRALCIALLRRAIALDPSFSAAQYRLSRALAHPAQPREEAQAAIEAALSHAGRLSPRDRLLAGAWRLHLAGDERGAHELCDRALRAFPDDAVAFLRAAEIRFADEDYPRAREHAERAHALAPESRPAALLAINALLAIGRVGEAEARARGRIATEPYEAQSHAILARALAAQGREAEAASVMARAITLGGESYRASLARNLLALGRHADAEHEALAFIEEARRIRDRAAAGEDLHAAQFGVDVGHWLVAESLAWRGRLREARDRLGEHGALAQARALLASGDRDLARARRELEAALELPDVLPIGPALLADAGELARAEELARRLDPVSAGARLHRAVTAWRAGGDLDPLRAAAAAGDPYAAFFLAEAAQARGDAAGVVDAVRRFEEARRIVPPWGAPADRLGMFGATAHPRSQVMLARALRALGDEAGARRVVGHLLAELSSSDPGLPVVAEARAVDPTAGLAATAQGVAALPPDRRSPGPPRRVSPGRPRAPAPIAAAPAPRPADPAAPR